MKETKRALLILLIIIFSGIIYADKVLPKEDTVQMSYEKLQSQQTVLGTMWMQTSAEYRASVYQVFNSAKNVFLIERGKNHKKKLAVIVDIDETVLDNMYTQAEYVKEGKNYSGKAWDEWVSSEKATAMPGAVEFVNFIYENGGEVFYLTNRKEAERERTLSNLLKENFIADNEHLIMKTSESSKESRRNQIEKNYEVVAYLGDDMNDFIDAGNTEEERKNKVDELCNEFGKKYFVIPNPVYGSFEAAVNSDYYKTDYRGRTQMRENSLKGWKE
jgi:5'-nucleotidase (lipoprotein e(P4) family)